MSENRIEKILNEKESLRKYLYPLGFLMTDSNEVSTDGYPFYGNWNAVTFSGYNFYFHPRQRYYSLEKNGFSFVVNGESKLCGKIKIDLSEKVTNEKYLYLYNEQKGKYQLIATEDIGELSIDTEGTYLLTSEPVSEWQWNVVLLVVAIVVILAGVGVYIGVKKQYWFW